MDSVSFVDITLMNAAEEKIVKQGKVKILIQPVPAKAKLNNLSNIKHFCFDLDGTLMDSSETIYKATVFALEKLGLGTELDKNIFNSKIGQHFLDIFKAMKIDVPDFQEFIQIYKSKYFDFIDDSILYPDVEETLASISSAGIKISLLTTKMQDQADKILQYFELGKHFDLIMGRRDGVEHKPSPEPLIIICNELKVKVEETLMIGDTEMDIRCGKNAKAKTCAVKYGYRNYQQLLDEKPDLIIESISELKRSLN